MRPAVCLWRLLAAFVLTSLLGCATVNTGAPAAPTAAAPTLPIDPWENWNRKVFGFNEVVDTNFLKPVATAYRDIVPSLVRKGITNVLGNIGDVWSAANHLLQGKVATGLEMGFRVLTNTFIGLGGVLDPATEFGMTRRSEDFGQTLGRWGLGNGPFLVLPLLGPSTVRDAAGFVLDRQASASRLPPTTGGSTAVTAIELVNTRTNLLPATDLLDQVALDKYSFVRDAYLQRRRDALYDGAPPMEDEFADEPGTPAAGKPAAGPAAKFPATPAAAAAGAAPKPATEAADTRPAAPAPAPAPAASAPAR